MIGSLGRVRIRHEIEGLNLNDRIVAWIPAYTECAETGCGFDPISRSAKNISCAVCSGTGRTETWGKTYISCRASWTDVGRPRFGGVVTTDILGDATLETRLPHKELMENLRDKEGAYIDLDGRHLRVMSVDVNRIEGKTNVVARCEIIHEL